MSTVQGKQTEPQVEPTEPTSEPDKTQDAQPTTEGKDPVPYDRFQQVNQKLADTLKRVEELDKLEADRQAKAKAETEKQLKEQQKYAELADQYKAELETATATATDQKAKIEKYEGVLSALYEARKTAVPEMYRSLLDNLDLASRLEWIATNEDKLKTPNGSNGIPPTPNPQGAGNLTPEQRRAKAKRTW